MTRIAIADDHPFLRAGLEAVLRTAGHEIAGSVSDGDEALKVIAQTNPDVVILDVLMPGRDGIAVLETLRRQGDRRPVILLTAHLDDARLVAAIKARVNAILFKQGAEQRLIETIRKVREGETVIDEDLLARAQELTRMEQEPDRFATLAPREREITEAVAMGLRNREIGERLGITEGSVKVYLNRIFDKLGVENRTELAIRVHERKDGN